MLKMQRWVPEVCNRSKLHKGIVFIQQENRKKKWIQENDKT